MTIDEYLDVMTNLGFSREGASRLISVASSTDELMDAPYNLVEREPGIWIVLQPDGRGGYSPANVEFGVQFVGRSLSDALKFVVDDTETRRRLYGAR
jgi:hypothetical protein